LEKRNGGCKERRRKKEVGEKKTKIKTGKKKKERE
jgi:hypothetical protein